jgi:hypothetical protein
MEASEQSMSADLQSAARRMRLSATSKVVIDGRKNGRADVWGMVDSSELSLRSRQEGKYAFPPYLPGRVGCARCKSCGRCDC